MKLYRDASKRSTAEGSVKQFDFILFILLFAVMIVGLIVLYSATRMMRAADGNRIFSMQVISSIIGMLLVLILSRRDYNMFKTIGPVLFAVGILALGLVFLFPPLHGARRWIDLRVLTVQPSEFMKIIFIIILAYALEKYHENGSEFRRVNIQKMIGYTLLPMILIFFQPDVGTTAAFAVVAFAMFYVAGLRYKYIFAGAVGVIVSFPVFWFLVIRGSYLEDRIMTFLDPSRDIQGAGFNVWISRVAVGSGRIFGRGFLRGNLTQTASVPIKESDFIFTAVTEEFGMIGGFVVIVLMTALVLRCIYVAMRAHDKFGCYLATGMATLLLLQMFQNIGMTMGMMPVTGIPLPFFSAGGTALLAYYWGIGIVMSVSYRRIR